MGKSRSNKRKTENNNPNSPHKSQKIDNHSIAYVQILGNGFDTQDTSPSVLLFFDNHRFIFNAGEGLQRYCSEYSIKLSKIDHIFFSRVCSETAGGLPGLLLTRAGIADKKVENKEDENDKETAGLPGLLLTRAEIADKKEENEDGQKKKNVTPVKISGPPGFNYFVDAMTTFIPNASLVHAKSFGHMPHLDGMTRPDPMNFSEPFDLIDDEVVKISAILLHPNEDNGTKTAIETRDISVIYVCELPKIPGKFNPEKAKKLGLKPGAKYRDLQNGISVKSDDRDIKVHPRDVMDAPDPGPVVLLVDCPTKLHFQSLLSVDSLGLYYADCSGNMSETTCNCVIHLSPSSVSNDPDYQKWMKRFGDAQHIMAGHQKKNVEIPVLQGCARLTARLNYLCPQFFPASGFWSSHTDNNSLHANSSTEESQAVISAENLLKFKLRPRPRADANLRLEFLDKSSIPTPTGPAKIVDELHAEIPEIVEAVQQVKQLWDHPMNVANDESSQNVLPSCLKNITRKEMEIVLLGTGASQPSKYRNVTSIFINLFSKGGLLFDCGEGTLGQLKRRFGVEGADDVVRSLRFLWISHMHADHHAGLARILALRRDLLKDVSHEPLLVVGPKQLERFLDAYKRLEDLDMQFLDCEETTRAKWDSFETPSNLEHPVVIPSPSNSDNGRVMLKKVLREAGLETLISFPVVHSVPSYGVSLTAVQRTNDFGEMIPGWKIVYSGDTEHCPLLIEEARGATVLIHEATFESKENEGGEKKEADAKPTTADDIKKDDPMKKKAEAKKHSTTNVAIEAGEAAGVYRIILTHFSQRYPKIPVLRDSHMHNNTCISFDLMSINLADLHVLPQIFPHLKLLFQNEECVDEK